MTNPTDTPVNDAPATDPGTATQTGGTNVDANNTPAQDPAQSTPDTITVPKSEYERLQNHSHRFMGNQPLVEAALNAGIKTPDDFQSFTEAQQKLAKFQEIGQDPDRILETLQGQSQAPSQPQQAQGIDPEQIRGIVGSEFAKSQHEQAWSGMTNSLVSKIDELAPDGSTPAMRSMVEALVQREAQGILTPYGPDSPLSGQYQPLSDAEINEVGTKVKQALDEVRGSQMRAGTNADPATQGQTGGLQSNSGGNGVAGVDNRPLSQRSQKEQQEAVAAAFRAAEQQHAQQAQGLMSGLGGSNT